MKIVIWGCGDIGRYTYHQIEQGEYEFEVVGFGDSYYSIINKNFNRDDIIFKYGKVYGYVEVKELYETGKIDGVIISVRNITDYRTIEENLEDMGVHIYKLDNTRISAFSVADYTYNIFNDKIKVNVISDVDIVINYSEYAFIMKNNKVLWESDRLLTQSRLGHFLFPKNISKKYDLIVNKACSLLFIPTDVCYGHFIFIVLNQIYAMENSYFDGKYILYESDFARQWVKIIQKIFDISSEKFVFIKCNNEYSYNIHVKEIHCLQNIPDSSKLNAEILHDFSKNVIDCLNQNENYTNITFPELLHVKRSEKWSRKLLPDTEKIIESYNFTTIIPEVLPVEMQIEYFKHAKIIIASHGSNIANLIFMKENTHLIDLFSSNYVDLFFIEAIKAKKIHFHMLVSSHEYNENRLLDFTINPELLKLTIEDVLASLK